MWLCKDDLLNFKREFKFRNIQQTTEKNMVINLLFWHNGHVVLSSPSQISDQIRIVNFGLACNHHWFSHWSAQWRLCWHDFETRTLAIYIIWKEKMEKQNINIRFVAGNLQSILFNHIHENKFTFWVSTKRFRFSCDFSLTRRVLKKMLAFPKKSTRYKKYYSI